MSRVQTLERSYGGDRLVEKPASIDYAAVPLDLTLDDEQYCPYARDSLDRINRRVDDAFENAFASGWVMSSDMESKLRLLVKNSLVTSHWERIDRNRAADFSQFADMEDPHVQRALAGTASPLELLYVLEKHPEAEALELAKLSHPLDSQAPKEMDQAVIEALECLGEPVILGEPRYKRKMTRDDIPAAIILRKQVISEYEAKHGQLQVVKRTAFLARGDKEAVVSPFLDRKVRNPARIKELGQKIEAYLPHIHENFRWLQPIATSYYAKYLTERKVEG